MGDLYKWEKEMIVSQIKLRSIQDNFLLNLGDQDFALILDERIKCKEAQMKEQL